MHTFAVYVCPHCHALQARTDEPTAPVVCPGCGFQNTTPRASLFGRGEWDRSQHPERMLACLKELRIELTPRKIRLVSCAAARAQLPRAGTDELCKAIATAEEWADTGERPKEAVRTRERFGAHTQLRDRYAPAVSAFTAAFTTGATAAAVAAIGRQCLANNSTTVEVRSYPLPELLAPIFQDLFPNPFVALTWNPDWFSSTVRDLAQHIYAHHEFTTMPILADALQDAGCTSEPVLAHCRANRPHARGCWVLDALLGKS